MYRIEYQVPTSNGHLRSHVIYCDDLYEADEIYDKCQEYGYKVIDISYFTEE